MEALACHQSQTAASSAENVARGDSGSCHVVWVKRQKGLCIDYLVGIIITRGHVVVNCFEEVQIDD